MMDNLLCASASGATSSSQTPAASGPRWRSASFIRAGIPLNDALAVITEDAPSKKLKEVLVDVSDRIRGGSSFTEAQMLAGNP